MITVVCVVAYLVADLYAARWIYGRLRARAIGRQAEKINKLPLFHEGEDPVDRYNEWDRGETVVFAVLSAALWPLVLTGFGLYRFVTHNPVLSRTELETQRDAMSGRIAELERELGINPEENHRG